MKKEKQQEQRLILLDYADASEKIPYTKSVWINVYGPLERNEDDSYTWAAEPFHFLPQVIRRELSRELINSAEMFDKEDSSLRDEFYNRIYSVLEFLLQDYSKAVFFTPSDCIKKSALSVIKFKVDQIEQMDEFLLWHRCGLPVSSRERQLLEQCLQKFLPNEPRRASGTSRAIKKKLKSMQTELRATQKLLKRNMRKHQKEAEQNPNSKEQQIISDKKYCEIRKRIFLFILESALYASNPILNGNFKSLEDVLNKE